MTEDVKKTSFGQMIFLNLFGLILTIVLLELTLRAAGFIVLYLQEKHNHFSLDPREYRILCLGESTTALGGEDSYPGQLEAMLNAKGAAHKYTVINKGIVSTTSNYILSHLDENLDQYRPQLVVVMMGINDRAYLHDYNKSLWWENVKAAYKELRVYKLARLLYEHVSHRISEINAAKGAVEISSTVDDDPKQTEKFLKMMISNCLERFTRHMAAYLQYERNQLPAQARTERDFAGKSIKEASSACVELARRYRFYGQFQEEQKMLQQATIFDPDSADAYQEWGEFYLAQEKSAQAVKAFQAALALDPKNSDVLLGLAHAYYQDRNEYAFIVYAGYLQLQPRDYWRYIEFAQWLREYKHDELASVYLNRAIETEPYFAQAYVDLGQILELQGQYQKAEEIYHKGISMRPHDPHLYRSLGQLYKAQGRSDLAQIYFQKEASQQMAEYCPATLVNYSLLIDKALQRHIKVIVMQYPLRDIGILKDYLGQRKGVDFVENRENFKQALKRNGYNFYFKDNFAYDFGHCTRAGNELIARNLSEVILKQ